MPADASQQLALGQLGHAKAAVPVAAAEQQAAVVGHDQHLGADVHPGGEGAAQEPLGSAQHTTQRSGRGLGPLLPGYSPHQEIYILNTGVWLS